MNGRHSDRVDAAETQQLDVVDAEWIDDEPEPQAGTAADSALCTHLARRWAAMLGQPVDDILHERSDGDWRQIINAVDLLAVRAALPDVVERAAVVLVAQPMAPEHESILGGKAYAGLNGQEVGCGVCKRQWVQTPEDPVLNPTENVGTCCPCWVQISRTDAAVPVIEGVIVDKPADDKPKRQRRPRKEAGT